MHYPLDNGLPMISTTLIPYQRVFETVTVVVRPTDEPLKALLGTGDVKLVDSPDYTSGMSQSLIAGVQANINADGWLIALGDMPYIQSDTVLVLASKMETSSIVVPRYRERIGNPVGFGRDYRNQLLEISGDRGAKQVVQSSAEQVIYVDSNDKGVITDIDVRVD